MTISSFTFKAFYDSYSSMLYSVSLDIAPSEEDAEHILTCSFIEIYRCGLMNSDKICSITLIRIVIETAQKCLKNHQLGYFRLSLFKNLPILNELICDQIGVDVYSDRNNISRKQILNLIHKEFQNMTHKK